MVVATLRWAGLRTGPISVFATSQGGRPPHVVLWSPVLGIGTLLEHQVGSFGCSDNDSSSDGFPFGVDDICRGFISDGRLGAGTTVSHEASGSTLGAEAWGSFER